MQFPPTIKMYQNQNTSELKEAKICLILSQNLVLKFVVFQNPYFSFNPVGQVLISFGVTESAFNWMHSFICGSLLVWSLDGLKYDVTSLKNCSMVPSCMFLVFTVDIQRLVESLGSEVLLYILDTHGLGFLQVMRSCWTSSLFLVRHWCHERLNVLGPRFNSQNYPLLTNSSGKACNAYV